MSSENTVGAYEAKTHLPKLLARVESGERITITKHGRPIAMLVPAGGKDREAVGRAIDGIKALQKRTGLQAADIKALIDEGRA